MSTPKKQRIGIWIIAMVLVMGTLMSFLVMALSVSNSAADTASQEKAYEEYLAQQEEASKTNAANSEPISGYATRTFDASSVTSLSTEVLVEGSGDTVTATDTINCSYFGWLSDGTIFDSSKKKSTDDAPIDISLSSVITGWTEGLTGQKVGSVVRLTIPSDKAYGTTGSGIIPANSPLEFIVKINSTTKAS